MSNGESQPDLNKLFPQVEDLSDTRCFACGIILQTIKLMTCINTLDDVEAEMSPNVFHFVESCMSGNCPTNGESCRGQRLADVSIKMAMNNDFEPNRIKWHSKKFERYLAERSWEKS